MDQELDLPNLATCTTCRFKEDLSNYWTAVMYFKHTNGSFLRVSPPCHARRLRLRTMMIVPYGICWSSGTLQRSWVVIFIRIALTIRCLIFRISFQFING